MSKLLPEFFRRIDERPDALFYRTPRSNGHVDEEAARFLAERNDAALPREGHILDLMAGPATRIPTASRHVVGVGINPEELHVNPTLTESVVHDVNLEPRLPFDDDVFDGALCSAAVQYLVHPLDTFCEVARVLKPGAPFIVAFTTRMYPEKAVLAWRTSDDAAHERLVRTYFEQCAAFGDVRVERHEAEASLPVWWLHATAREAT